jgi:hypothetical protein
MGLDVTLLVCIREVLGVDLGRDAGHTDRYFLGFPQSLKANSEVIPVIGTTASFQTFFQYHSAVFLPSDARY